MRQDVINYELRLGIKDKEISKLKGIIDQYNILSSVLQGEVDYLQLSYDSYQKDNSSKRKFGIIREVSLWVIALGELTAILFLSTGK